MHFLLLWYDKVPHKTLALMSQALCMCSARAELSLKLKKDGWVKNRRTDGHPLIADGKTNCRARPKSKCGGWSKPAQISLLCQPHAYTHHLMQADGQPALMPSKQRPPMSRGLFSLPSLMLTLPHNTRGTKTLPSHRRLQSTDGHCSTTAPQCSKSTFHPALEADLIYSA